MEKRKNDALSLLLLAVVFIIGFATAVALTPQNQTIINSPSTDGSPSLTGAAIAQLPCMDTTGCVETDISVDATNIYLTAGCFRLVLTTNELQTYSINSGMKGTRGPRPTTHDVMLDIMNNFELEPIIVKINSLNQGTYFATMAVKQGVKVLDMDIRPSDAVAIAVRTNTPVWANQTLLEQNGEFLC